MLAWGRVVIGSTLLVAPRRAGERWLGPIAHDRRVVTLMRATAARDLAIGAGTLGALAEGAPVRGWALAGAAGDITDALATVAMVRQVGVRRALPVIAAAAVATAAGLSAADHLAAD
jgi:hypothetical protein